MVFSGTHTILVNLVAENRKTFVPKRAKYDGEKYSIRVLTIVRESTAVHEIKDQAVDEYGEWKYRCTRINHDTSSSYVISCTPTHIH
jgi:hypothetical protein